MAASNPDLAEIARRLVADEAGDSPDAAAVAAAVEEACERLGSDLTRMIGAHGFSALLARALHLATREHPTLAEVTLDAKPGSLGALPQALARATPDEATHAGGAILAHLWTLLVLLLGEELGMQPVYKLWPHLAPDPKEIAE